MESITITCPEEGADFAVVEPFNHSDGDSFTVTCPSCQMEIPVVYPNELSSADATRETMVPYDGEEIVDWEHPSDGPKPYTGSDKEIPFKQYVRVTISGIGGDLYGMEEDVPQEELVLSGEQDRFQIWYTPDHDPDSPEQVAYVVRADLETGVKTKNVYMAASGGPNLYVKNRGVPRDSEKNWTYLDEAECRTRVDQAGLSGEIEQSDTNRYNAFLNHNVQPLVTDDGQLAEELVKELCRMLIAFQTARVQ